MTSFVRGVGIAIAAIAAFVVLQGTALATTCNGLTCCVPCAGGSICNAPAGCNGCTTCVICGTATSETINGTSGKDVICGEGGDDVIDGKANDDTIFGGSGNNVIYGGTGHDYLYGSYGDDTIYGDDGNDHLDGGGGSDLLNGGSGTDTISQNIPVKRELPDDFIENITNDFSYTVSIGPPYTYSESLGYVSSLTADVCGSSVTAPGAGYNTNYVLDPGGDHLLLSPSNEMFFGSLVGLSADVQFVAPAAGLYQFEGSFARDTDDCGTSGDGVVVTIDPGSFSESIGPTDTTDHTFSIGPLTLARGDAVKFSVRPGTSLDPTNDVTELKLTVTPLDADLDEIVENLPSTLCGGTGNNDTLTATGPGRMCLDGGAGTGDTCAFTPFFVPPIDTRDVGVSTASCETASGTSPTRHPSCGCN